MAKRNETSGVGDYFNNVKDSFSEGIGDLGDRVRNFGSYYQEAAAKNAQRMENPNYAKMEKKRRLKWWSYMLFPVLIFYYEMVFHFSTVPELRINGLICTFLFSCVAGWLVYLIRSFIPFKRGVICTNIIILLLSLPFFVEFFVFVQFNIFYDINTITGGAGGVLTEFLDDIIKMLLSLNGIIHIILFLLPIAVYSNFVYRKDRKKRMKPKQKIRMLLAILVVFLLARIFVALGSTAESYSKQYNFQDVVANYGLLTGIRRDIKETIAPSSGGFEKIDTDSKKDDEKKDSDTETATEGTEVEGESQISEAPVAPIVYGKNELKIDFEALAASDSGTTKSLDEYCATLEASSQNQYTGIFKGKNLIFISAEAFTAEAIRPDLTPTLYRMATKGINFTDYYQPASAGTTGGEYQNVFGLLPTSGGKSFKNTSKFSNYFTMGNQLNRLGYAGWAFHNNTYTYYGRDVTHNNLGYSNGYMGYGNGMEEYVKKAWPESDLEMINGTFPLYADSQPFNIYYMSVSGHSAYGQTVNAQSKINWDRVSAIEGSEIYKGYLACNLTLEDAMASLISQLEAKGIADNTVIVISADHFPYGMDEDGKLGAMPYLSELYGYKVVDRMQRDHNRLIIWSGSLEKEEPIVVDTPTTSLDILPTLSNLFGTDFDSRLFPGRDVFSDAPAIAFNLNYDWKTELGTYLYGDGFTPATPDTVIPDGYVEQMKKIVSNKIKYCKGLQEVDYWGHVMKSVQ